MGSAKVLAKVKSAASCGSVLPCGAGQCAFVPDMFRCPAETSSLFGQKVEEGADHEEQANGVQWQTSNDQCEWSCTGNAVEWMQAKD